MRRIDKHIERRIDDDIVKNISEIIVEGSRGRVKPKKNWIWVIEEDIKTCRVNDKYS